MGLFGKIKDILFDEEEVIEEKKEQKVENVKSLEKEHHVQTEYRPPVVERPTSVDHVYPARETQNNPSSNMDSYKVENTFPFPDFDEDEFDQVRPIQKPKTTNVLDFERNKRKEKKMDHPRLDRVEVVEKKKFKPSPIISPVYGILNEDYVAEDITNRGDPIPEKKSITVESVRKKAFGSLDEPVKKEIYKEVETVKSYEPIEEKQQKVKTIDELLEDTSDVKISLDEEEVIAPIEEDVVEEPSHEKKEVSIENSDYEDTLENDLFDLIDSMYDKGEDGE